VTCFLATNVLASDAIRPVGKAKTAYEELLRLWKDADAEIPVVSEARAEYARLP
jgi:hypothetical protein